MEQHRGRVRHVVDPTTMWVCEWGATLVFAGQEGVFAFVRWEDAQVEDHEQEGAQTEHDEHEDAQTEHDEQERAALPIDLELSG